MEFWKMQGCGNDFIIIDGRFDGREGSSYSEDAAKYCARKFSIGADGFIIVKNSDKADVNMVYYNADGSRGEMCGNGIRCFSKYVIENNIVNKSKFTVETLNGIKEIDTVIEDNSVSLVSVYMGQGFYEPTLIPVDTTQFKKDMLINETINVLDREFTISSVLMGVPHTVAFVSEDMSLEDIKKYGKEIENHDLFPKNTNVNFVKVINRNNISVQTWERGCGYTFGCGTGMTAAVMISNLLDKTDDEVSVFCEGGKVDIILTESGAFMIGSAEKIYVGHM